jgi:hypothetical protein
MKAARLFDGHGVVSAGRRGQPDQVAPPYPPAVLAAHSAEDAVYVEPFGGDQAPHVGTAEIRAWLKASWDSAHPSWCSGSTGSTSTAIRSRRDQDALQQAAQAPWFAEYMGQAAPLLAGEPQVTMASPVWETGLAR